MHNEILNDQAFEISDQESLSTDSSPRTILLVDDDPDIRSLTRTFLEHEGYRVHSCGDPRRAGQVFYAALQNDSDIDLLITDFYMPDQSGIELAREFKQSKPELPVLLVSGGFLGADYLEQLRNEGWHFLGKPFALPDLLTAVHLILKTSVIA
jgi:two-component system chemotaxis response regulator CheY